MCVVVVTKKSSDIFLYSLCPLSLDVLAVMSAQPSRKLRVKHYKNINDK